MRIIFLDVDGVLNNSKTEDKVCGWTGIDPKLLQNLKYIYDESNKDEETKIIVSSSWKYDEVRAIKDAKLGYEKADNIYSILVERLNNAGMEVLGYTTETRSAWERGEGISKWIEEYNKDHEPISNYVILDDEEFDFSDYEDLYKRFVRTVLPTRGGHDSHSYKYEVGSGIQQRHIEKALSILRYDFNK